MSAQGQWPTLLQQRAVALAQPTEKPESSAGTDVLILSVAGRRLALESRYVRQVVRSGALSRLPASTTELIGLTVVHGEAVPVADLGSLLGLGSGELRRFTLILGVDEPPIGVLVDAVLTADTLPRDSLDTAHVHPRQSAPLEVGITPDGAVILDGRALLDDDRLHSRSHTTSHPQGAAPDGGRR
jgi:purine-binding chemotaxis protein CheW